MSRPAADLVFACGLLCACARPAEAPPQPDTGTGSEQDGTPPSTPEPADLHHSTPEGDEPSTTRTTDPDLYVKQLQKRRRTLDQYLERHPNDPQKLATLAACHLELLNLDADLGHVVMAERLLSRAIDVADTAALRRQRAAARRRLHRFADASADLESALRLAPDDLETKRALEWGRHAGRARDAAEALLATPADEPKGFEEHRREAMRLFRLGRFEEADQRLRQGHDATQSVHPATVAGIELQRGLLRLRTGRHDDANRFFRAAYTRLPQYGVVVEHLAESEALLGRHAAALKLYGTAVKQTRRPEAMAGRARVLRSLKRADEAARGLHAADKRWRQLLPRFGVAVARPAVRFWLEDLPRPADALRWSEAALTNARDPESMLLTARARAAARESAGARALLAEVELAPLVADEFYAGIADAWFRLGEAERAATWHRKARALNSAWPEP